jgi:hypothetical protein
MASLYIFFSASSTPLGCAFRRRTGRLAKSCYNYSKYCYCYKSVVEVQILMFMLMLLHKDLEAPPFRQYASLEGSISRILAIPEAWHITAS